MTPDEIRICCIPERATVTGESGRVYAFEWIEWGGPWLLTKRDEPWKRMPSEKHEFWAAFYEWFEKRKESR